eukprot:m.24796 g.24796  ORF g.24796 m.24796 type:complete len:101 (+) comp9130_c0_seq1:665-967(+)
MGVCGMWRDHITRYFHTSLQLLAIMFSQQKTSYMRIKPHRYPYVEEMLFSIMKPRCIIHEAIVLTYGGVHTSSISDQRPWWTGVEREDSITVVVVCPQID